MASHSFSFYCIFPRYCIALQCIALYCIVLHCIALYCIALYCIALYCIIVLLYCMVSPSFSFYYIFPRYCITLYSIVLHCIALYCIVLHCMILHCSNALLCCRGSFWYAFNVTHAATSDADAKDVQITWYIPHYIRFGQLFGGNEDISVDLQGDVVVFKVRLRCWQQTCHENVLVAAFFTQSSERVFAPLSEFILGKKTQRIANRWNFKHFFNLLD